MHDELPAPPTPRSLAVARAVTFGSVALAFPVSGVAVFAFGADRHAAAGPLPVVHSVCLALGLSTAFWPLPALRSWRAQQRVESFVVTFLAMSCLTT